ncbi:acyl-coenzyme A thioesterase 1-like isoform X1 [Acipenser ruthenus]|uniref:acyl-coenzyme A thioesterase 1-like isoform X1 n=2 Tax=Acipenser ruthenus TaxID=7906 RepID=UPI00145B1BB5|nr:acyl-coenzyme A thioesterase 1-like isoform X1 [Acipenser ruthenus]
MAKSSKMNFGVVKGTVRLCILKTMLFPRHCLSTAAACHSPVRVRLLPSPKCLFDQPVQVKVEGLSPNQEVVLRAKLTDEKGEPFQSSATYRADGIGEIDLSRSPALGGSFSGTDPMGLFWALSAKNAHKKLVKRDVRTPFLVDIEVYSDGDTEGQLLAKETNERGFLAEGVQRLPVREGRVRATLFLPPGRGPFPGVLDMYGTGGGLPEYRASLLASRGFAVLALAYYSYLDLPKDMRELDLEYFEEAVSFLRTHPQVKGPGIGVLAISKSGDLALSMASFLPGISATVSINGCNANTLFPLRYKGTVFPPLSFKTSRQFLTKSGIANIRDTLNNPTEGENRQSLIPIEQAQCRFLFVVAEDDQNWKSPFYAEEAAKRLREHGKENCEVVVYPGAGHYLEPPYFPHCPSSLHLLVGLPVVWGGEPRSHGEAQVDLWGRIQAFFIKHLDGEHLQG